MMQSFSNVSKNMFGSLSSGKFYLFYLEVTLNYLKNKRTLSDAQIHMKDLLEMLGLFIPS